MFKDTIPCDEIVRTSWDNMPVTMRVNDFCKHCEFKCEHGKELISHYKNKTIWLYNLQNK